MAQSAFREDADDFPFFDLLAGFTERLLRPGGGNQKAACATKAENRTQPWVFGEAIFRDEPDRARKDKLQHNGVNNARVVRQHDEAAGGQSFKAAGFDPVNEAGEQTAQSRLQPRNADALVNRPGEQTAEQAK